MIDKNRVADWRRSLAMWILDGLPLMANLRIHGPSPSFMTEYREMFRNCAFGRRPAGSALRVRPMFPDREDRKVEGARPALLIEDCASPEGNLAWWTSYSPDEVEKIARIQALAQARADERKDQ